jgi:DNA segregation ATPase FtsK/SpoIIIE, S-DNA-T family
VSRWTRRMRRRFHRRNVRGEPLTLLVDNRYPGAPLDALARAIYRYPSELVPLVLGAATGLTAAFLHSRFPGWAPVIALLTLVGSAALWWAERLTSGLRRIERVYAAAVTGAAGLWLATTTAVDNGTVPLPALLALAILAAAVPRWRHRRRRARVRVERTPQAWPDITEGAGLTSSRVMSVGRRPVTAYGQLAISEYHRCWPCCRNESRAETRGWG